MLQSPAECGPSAGRIVHAAAAGATNPDGVTPRHYGWWMGDDATVFGANTIWVLVIAGWTLGEGETRQRQEQKGKYQAAPCCSPAESWAVLDAEPAPPTCCSHLPVNQSTNFILQA